MTLTKDQRRRFKRFGGGLVRDTQPKDRLRSRVDLKKIIEAEARDGMVYLIESGRDCDGTHGTCSHHVPANVPAVEREINRIFGSVEGPTDVWVSADDDLLPDPEEELNP